jgi:hypothetical protein
MHICNFPVPVLCIDNFFDFYQSNDILSECIELKDLFVPAKIFSKNVMIRLATVPAVSVTSISLHRDEHLRRSLTYGFMIRVMTRRPAGCLFCHPVIDTGLHLLQFPA